MKNQNSGHDWKAPHGKARATREGARHAQPFLVQRDSKPACSPGSGGPVAALTAKEATGGQVTRPALVKVERSLASNTLTPPQAEQGEYVRSPPDDSAP